MLQERIYRVSPGQTEGLRRKAVTRNVLLALLMFFVPLAVTESRHFRGRGFPFPDDAMEVLILTAALALLGLVLSWAIWKGVRQARAGVDQLLSLEIVVDENSVTRRQSGIVQSSLPFGGISRIEEYRIGFKVQAKSGPGLWVPKSLENFEELKTQLLAASGAEFISKKSFWRWETVFVVGFLASLIILLFGNRLLYLRAAAFYVIVFMLVGVGPLLRSPDFQAKQKARVALGLTLLLLFVVARAIPLWPF